MRRRQAGEFELDKAKQQEALRAEEARLKADRERRLLAEETERQQREHKRILRDEQDRKEAIRKRQRLEQERIRVESTHQSGGKPISRDASALTEKVEQDEFRNDGRANPRGHRPRK